MVQPIGRNALRVKRESTKGRRKEHGFVSHILLDPDTAHRDRRDRSGELGVLASCKCRDHVGFIHHNRHQDVEANVVVLLDKWSGCG
jgi:hypothetical protein